jgi:hypothetical protein
MNNIIKAAVAGYVSVDHPDLEKSLEEAGYVQVVISLEGENLHVDAVIDQLLEDWVEDGADGCHGDLVRIGNKKFSKDPDLAEKILVEARRRAAEFEKSLIGG